MIPRTATKNATQRDTIKKVVDKSKWNSIRYFSTHRKSGKKKEKWDTGEKNRKQK